MNKLKPHYNAIGNHKQSRRTTHPTKKPFRDKHGMA